MSCTVRLAGPKDLDALEDLLRNNASDEDANALVTGAAFPHYIAIADETVVGTIEGHFDSQYDDWAPADLRTPQSWIYLVLVDGAASKSGVGRELVRSFARLARDRGREFVALNVEDGAGEAERVAFFTRCGLRKLSDNDPDGRRLIMGASVSDILADHPHISPS